MAHVKASKLQPGDVFISKDGRGYEKVTFNRPYVKGKRSVRTTRTDHHVPNDRTFEVVCGVVFRDAQNEPCVCTYEPNHPGSHRDEFVTGERS